MENNEFVDYVDQYSMEDIQSQKKRIFSENNLATFSQIFNVNKLNSFLQGNPKFANKYFSGQKEQKFKLSTNKASLIYTNSPDIRNNYSEKQVSKQKKNALILQKLQESQQKQDLLEEELQQQQLQVQQQQQQIQSVQKKQNSKRKNKKNYKNNQSQNIYKKKELNQHNNNFDNNLNNKLMSSAEPSQMFTSPKKINKILYENNQMSGQYINSEFSFDKFQYSAHSNAYIYDTPPIKTYNSSSKYVVDDNQIEHNPQERHSSRQLMQQGKKQSQYENEGEPQLEKKIKKNIHNNNKNNKLNMIGEDHCDIYESNELISDYKFNVSDQKENAFHAGGNHHLHPPSHNLLGNNNGGNNHLMFNLMSKFESPSRLLNLCNTPDKFLNHNNNGYGNHFNNNNGFKLVNQFQYDYQKSPLILKTPLSVKKEKL